MKYCVFHVEGGLGKNVAATAVARCIKKTYPDKELVIVCSYPEVFLHLPFVHRVYRLGITPYFFQEYIEGKDTLIFKHEPYFTTDHIYKRKNLIQNWCELYGLQYDGELPELNISKRIRDFVKVKYARNKPIMLMQTNGGLFQPNTLPYSWTRDMPKEVADVVAKEFSQKYHILQVCRTPFNVTGNSEGLFEPMSNLEIFSLLFLSEKRLLIDSCLQHAAAALNMPSTVLWIGSPSDIFGYEMHTNIQAKAPLNRPKLPDSYLFDYNFDGMIHEYPYGEKEQMFDTEKIIATLK